MRISVLITPFSSSHPIAGELLDFAPGEVKLVADRAVPVGSSLIARFKNVSFEGEAMFCRANESHYDINVRVKDADDNGLRRSPRFTVNIPARLYTQAYTDPHAIPARIVDISGHGLGVESAVPLQVGETIAIESEMNLAFGIVAHSRRQEDDLFRCGIALHHALQKENDATPTSASSNLLSDLPTLIRHLWRKLADKADRNSAAQLYSKIRDL